MLRNLVTAVVVLSATAGGFAFGHHGDRPAATSTQPGFCVSYGVINQHDFDRVYAARIYAAALSGPHCAKGDQFVPVDAIRPRHGT